MALAQLNEGVPLMAIQAKNCKMFKAQAYPDQLVNLATCNYQWILKSQDTRALYW